MKKMMVALVGIVSVLMLASCEKVTEVEIVGNSTYRKYNYRMEVTGTASYVLAEWDSATKTYKAKEGAKAVELVVNAGQVSWDEKDSVYDNVKTYKLSTWYDGNTDKDELSLSDLYENDWEGLREYRGEFYFPDVGSEKKATVTGNPEDESFTVKVTDCLGWKKVGWIQIGDEWQEEWQHVLYTFDLTFTR